MDIKISGIEETLAALDAAPRYVAKNALARALAAASVPVSAALAVRAIKHDDSGAMSAHQVTDIEINANGAGGFAQIGFGKFGFRARMIEFGHRLIGHKPNLKEIKVLVADPFMGPAAEESSAAAIDAFAASIDESLQGDVLKRAS